MCTMRGRLTAAQAVGELLTVRPGPVWSGVARVVAEHRHVRQDSERMGDLLYHHSQPYSCALDWMMRGGRASSRSVLAWQTSPVHQC